MTDKHDFKSILRFFDFEYDNEDEIYNGSFTFDLSVRNVKLIQTALRIADRLQSGDVSERMMMYADGYDDTDDIFIVMAQQMMKEVEDE